MPRNTTISSLHARELKSDVDWDPLHHMIRMQVSYKRAVRFLTVISHKYESNCFIYM